MGEIKNNERTDMRLALNRLSEKDLEELAKLVVRKLRESVRQESDRSGRS